MYDRERASRFLRAIDKNAKKQQSEILEEMKNFEKREVEKVEAEIIEDVRVMIQREIESMKNKIAIEVSHKEMDERKKIAHKRQEMMRSVFEESEKRLIEFTRTQEYRECLIKYTQNISKKLKGDDVVLYVYEEDLKYKEMIEEAFGRSCRVEADESIKVGGIRGFSEQDQLVADETIDEKLCTQEEWFLEKYGNTLVHDFLKSDS